MQTLLFLSWLAVLGGFALALAVRVVQYGLALSFVPRDRSLNTGEQEKERALGLFAATALWSVGLYIAVLKVPARFHNLELAALLVVVIALALAVVLLSFARLASVGAAALRRSSPRWFVASYVAPCVGVSVGAVGALLWYNRSGLQQLNQWLLASVLAGCAGYFVGARIFRSRSLSPRAARVSVFLALGCGALSCC